MELSKWFDYQLRSTLDGFIWSVQQLPQERWYAFPPIELGEWSAAQHVLHMLEYEQGLALPSMYQWLGAPPPGPEADVQNGEQDLPPMDEMLSQFRQVRESEIGLLSKFKDQDWHSLRRTTFWGEVNLYWLVCKTYQHTAEHTHDILRLGLFWDRIRGRRLNRVKGE
jgi:hypothetical protein